MSNTNKDKADRSGSSNIFVQAKKIAQLIEAPEKAEIGDLRYLSSGAVSLATEKFLERASLKAVQELCNKLVKLSDDEEENKLTATQWLELAKAITELKMLVRWERSAQKLAKVGTYIPPLFPQSKVAEKIEKNADKLGISRPKKQGPGLAGRSRTMDRTQLKPESPTPAAPSDLPIFSND